MDINEFLIKGSIIKSSLLKERLFKLGLKKNQCEICGLNSWQDKPLVCELHHIDGDRTNNTFENLQILCPNCHSQTDNFRGHSLKSGIKYFCKNCGKEITKNATYCVECYHKSRRVVTERPTLEQLEKDKMDLKSFNKIGKKYGVCGATIRKWFKYYNRISQ